MKGLPCVRGAAYSDICEGFEQRMGNPQWKGFPPFAVTVDLIRVFLVLGCHLRTVFGAILNLLASTATGSLLAAS